MRVVVLASVLFALPALAEESVSFSAAPSHVVTDGQGQGGALSRPTFSREVVRILQSRCQTCHHDGGIAPFPLVTYADAYARRAEIAFMTSHRLMPPWKAAPGCAKYKDDPSLTQAQIATLSAWNAAGAPEGDPAHRPPPLSFPERWELGEPDLVLTMREAFTPPFGNGDVYRCFVLPTGESSDRYVASAEVSPGSRAMVHHVILYLDDTGVSERLDAEDPGPGYACFGGPGFTPSFDAAALGGWVPGNKPPTVPDGIGMKLPKGARVVMQLHYSDRSGVVEPDLTRVGIRWAKPPVHKALRFLPLANQTFRIPAGDPAYTVQASIPYLVAPMHAWNITPHMHLLGKAMRVEASGPAGSVCLVDVKDWDFHWQFTYSFAQPVALPFGTALSMSATFDNSAANPHNPNDPPKDVTWGERTTDEMALVFIGVTLDGEELAP